MENQEALNILSTLREKPGITAAEKEALSTAIGVLSLGAQIKNRMKALKAKRDKSAEW